MKLLLPTILLWGWLMHSPVSLISVERLNSELSKRPAVWIQDSDGGELKRKFDNYFSKGSDTTHSKSSQSRGVSIPLFDFVGEGKKFQVNGVPSTSIKPRMLSLELLSDESGNGEPLNKQHVIDSGRELAAMSDNKLKMNDLIPSCNAVDGGSKILFSHCPGDLVVITIAGSMKMSCNQIEKRTFYGPVILKNTNCQQSFVFDRDCVATLKAGFESSTCDSAAYLTVIWIQAGLITTIVLLTACIFLWFIKLKRGIRVGECIAKLTRNGWYYTTEYEEHVNSEGNTVRSLIHSELELNAIKKHYKIHLLRFALFLLFCRPLSVDGFSLMKQYDAMKLKHVYSLILTDSEIIHMGSSIIKREPVYFGAQLMPLFKTASWFLDHKDEYFCQWSSCDQIANCGLVVLPFKRGSADLNTNLGFGKYSNAYTTCMKIYGYCAFGWGCKMLGFEVKYNSSKLYSVYSISSGGSHGGVITVPPGCVVENLVDSSSGLIKGYYLVTDHRFESWLCHESVFSRKPVSNLLGDFQIFPDGSESFMSQDIHCSPDWERPSICRYPSPFIDSIRDLCHKPSEFGMTVSVDLKNSLISWRQSGSASLNIKCDRELPLPIDDSSCTDMDIRLWEVSNLNSIVLLSFVGHSHGLNAMFKFPESVFMKTSVFRCDGVVYYTELYDIHSLNSSGISFSQHTIPYEKIDIIQHDHFSSSSDSPQLSSSWLEKIFEWLPILITVSIILILICALNSLKKLIT